MDNGSAIRSNCTQFMTWNLVSSIVHFVEETYDKGVIVSPDEVEDFLLYWKRDKFVPKYLLR